MSEIFWIISIGLGFIVSLALMITAISDNIAPAFFVGVILMVASITPLIIFIKTPLPEFTKCSEYPLFIHEGVTMAIVSERLEGVYRIVNANRLYNKNINPEEYILVRLVSQGKSGPIIWARREKWELQELQDSQVVEKELIEG